MSDIGLEDAEIDEENVVRSDKDHFGEKDECIRAIQVVCDAAVNDHGAKAKPLSPCNSGGSEAKPEEIETENTIKILEKYQEQSHLLDKHLEVLVNTLMDTVKAVIRMREADRAKEQELAAPSSFPFQVYWNNGLQLVLKLLYTLCKVRGYKSIVKHLPHEVADLEPVLWLLQCQDTKDYSTWETRYSLLLWMSMLVLIPFDLENVDSSLANKDEGDSQGSLVKTVTDMCKNYLQDTGPCREAAAICIARLLTRPDMESMHLEGFLQWCAQTLEDINSRRESNESISTDTFLVTGVFQALTEVFKYGHREKLMAHIPLIFSRVIAVTNREGQSSLERKLTMKLVQRSGLNFLPPKVVSWRYQRGRRSLLQNLNQSINKHTIADQEQHLQGGEEEEEEEEFDIPDEVEDVIEKLLCGLRDRDTIVRWSAAKGIGRITSRLPLELADDVVAFVLELFDVSEGDSAWHGGCLALAELARRGLLLPDRLQKVVPFVVDALIYDVRRGHNSVGSNVRDAACYVCWAFARAYEPTVMASHVAKLSQQMLVTALFDREVNCRRAASAAFQENVGRQGHENFPHGIEILTAADYFTLGVRSNAYLKIASFVAKFEFYRRPLIDHLVERKIVHWDLSLRTLSGEALHVLCSSSPEYMANTILPDLLPKTLSPDMLIRHGSTLGVGELVTAFSKISFQLNKESLAEVRNTVMRIEKARLYRGRGGEWMRVAACKLIQSIAVAGQPLTFRAQKRLLESINESMKHPKDEVKEAAIAALQAMCEEYFCGDGDFDYGSDFLFADVQTGHHSEAVEISEVEMQRLCRPTLPQAMSPVSSSITAILVDDYCEKLENLDPNPAVRRGCALALGVLPARIVGSTSVVLERVVNTLVNATRMEDNIELRDAETRRNAVISLGNLVETVGIQVPGMDERKIICTATLSSKQVKSIMEALFQACEDFETDNRGDVGSWVRTVAIKSLMKVVRTIRSFPGRVLQLKKESVYEPTVSTKSFGTCRLLRFIGAGNKLAAWISKQDEKLTVRKVVVQEEFIADSGEEEDWSVPPLRDRRAVFVPNGGEKAIQSVTSQQPLEGGEMGVHIKSVYSEYLGPALSLRILNCIIKQLCEKISQLRECAGTAFEELLQTADDLQFGIPFTIPHLKQLQKDFLSSERHWKAESFAFPAVANILSKPEFTDAALSGLVASVGDLTESVSRNASEALLHWCKIQKGNSCFNELSNFSMALLRLLEENAKCDRVVVPTLKAFDLVLEAQVLTFRKSPRLPWLLKLHDAIKSEIKGCSNITKLVMCSKVLFHLASFKPPVRTVALSSVMILLGHMYPRVRMSCARDFNMWALAMDGGKICGDSEDNLGENFHGESISTESKGEENGDLLDFMREQMQQYEQELSSRPDAQRTPMEPGFDPESAFENAQEVIGDVAWDTITTKQARCQRDKLYPLLRINKPESKSSKTPEEEARKEQSRLESQQQKEEEDSYATLVHSAEMGYK